MRVMPHAQGIIPQHPCPCPSQRVTYPTGCRRMDDQHDVGGIRRMADIEAGTEEPMRRFGHAPGAMRWVWLLALLVPLLLVRLSLPH